MAAKTNESAEPHTFRFSIAGMMLLTSVVAAHLAIGRWELGLIAVIAPLTLSVAAIEALRRQFRMRFMPALVGGILLGAVLYALTIGTIGFSRWWQRLHEAEMLQMYTPTVAHDMYLTARNEFYAGIAWYLIVGMLVMLVYAAYIVVRDRRAARRIRLEADERRAARPISDNTSGDA